jgi:hypothetical protein
MENTLKLKREDNYTVFIKHMMDFIRIGDNVYIVNTSDSQTGEMIKMIMFRLGCKNVVLVNDNRNEISIESIEEVVSLQDEQYEIITLITADVIQIKKRA